MRNFARVVAVLATVTLLGGCGGGNGATASASTAPQPSASPSCETPDRLTGFPVQRSALGLQSGGVFVLTIEAGPAPLCQPEKISLSTYQVKDSGMILTVGKTEPVGEYDGTRPLSAVFPVLASPCLTAIFHTGSPPRGDALFLEKFTGMPALADGKMLDIIAGVSSADAPGFVSCR